MEYKTIQVTTGKTLRDFLKLPDLVYRNDSNYVPPFKSEVKRVLNTKKNPYFTEASLKLFNCYKEGKICARTAIIINSFHQEKFGMKSAFFGFFESLNDSCAVKELFSAAEKYCRSKSIEFIEGPFNPNHYSELGLQVNNYGLPPSFFKPYNPEYYNTLLMNVGFGIEKKFHIRKNKNIREYITKQFGEDDLSYDSNYTIRSFRMNELELELERLRDVFNDAFSDNWHFLPVSKEEYLFSAKYFKLVTEPQLLKFVEYKNNPVAAIHCVLEINPLLKEFNGRVGPIKYVKFLRDRKKIDSLIIFAIGIKKAFRCTQAFQALLAAGVSIMRNYKAIESSWMSEDNKPSIRAAERLGMKPDDELAIYKKQII